MAFFNLEDKTKMIKLICLLFYQRCCVFTADDRVLRKCIEVTEKKFYCQEKGFSGVRCGSVKSLDF